jgi:DnaJ-class molecular chaperone
MKSERLKLSVIGDRLEHGLPLTIDQSRYLWNKATGKKIVPHKRCMECNGTGVERYCFNMEIYPERVAITCEKCSGTGFLQKS